MAVPDPLIGQTIGGYRIVELVGRGGMGSVYRARDEGLRRDIALKLLRQDDLGDAREAERFRREARLAASLNHPNIVAIYGAGSERGYLYLAMELVDGESLRARVRQRRGPQPLDEALAIGEQLLEALRVSHAHGIVHRDIKPENIVVRGDGTVKVLDFGVARLEGGTVLTRADELVGTVEYMAPEQILGDGAGPAADQYAAGVVIYELVTGTKPFSGESPATLVYHQLNETPPSPSLLNPAVSRALDRFLLRALGKVPEGRFGTTAEALEALREVRRRQQVASAPDLADDAGGEDEPEPEELSFRFTGRDAELQALQDKVAETRLAGDLLFVAGEAGIGKSRLVAELTARVQAGKASRVVRGVCFFEHGMGPYMPFLDAIANLFGPGPQPLTEEERESLADLLAEQAPELSELATKSSTTAKVRASLAAAFHDERDPEGARQRLFDALFDLLSAAAAHKPLVIVLEDLHWADEGSLLMLQSVARRLAEAPILWLVTYRTEEVEEDEGLGGVLRQLHAEGELQEIRLQRLGREPLERMVRSAFRTADFPPEFGDYLYTQSQGNPLVAAEVVGLLRGNDLLYADSGVWTVRPGLPVLEVPGRIRALISQRLDQLADDQRELLQVAAVVGQRFTSEVLGVAAGLPRIDLLRALFRLERQRRLITSAAGGYEFSHSTVREVLYAEIPYELRKEYHGLVARALRARLEEGHDVEDEELGTHLFGAEDYGGALPHLLAAADEAYRLFGWRRAAELFDQADEAARHADGSPADRFRALQKAARAHGYLTAYEEALERCERLRQVASDMGTVPLAEAWKLTAALLDEQRRFDEAVDACRRALECLNGGGPAALRADIELSWGLVDFESGRYAEAEQRLRDILEFIDEDEAEVMARVCNNLALMETIRGNLDAAWPLYERALAQDGGEPPSPDTMMTLWNMGMLRADQERWDEALELYDRSLDVCHETRYFYHEPTVHLNRVEALLGKGEIAEARQACSRALRGYRRLDDALGLADAMRMYGRLCRIEKNWDDSRDYLERSIEMNRRFGESVSLGEALYERGLLEADRGDAAAAIASLHEAERIFTAVEAAADLSRTQALLARLEAA